MKSQQAIVSRSKSWGSLRKSQFRGASEPAPGSLGSEHVPLAPQVQATAHQGPTPATSRRSIRNTSGERTCAFRSRNSQKIITRISRFYQDFVRILIGFYQDFPWLFVGFNVSLEEFLENNYQGDRKYLHSMILLEEVGRSPYQTYQEFRRSRKSSYEFTGIPLSY